MRFRDRADGGRRLAERLLDEDLHDPLVLALPRGGVPVAYEVAAALQAPLDVFVARKIGAPTQPELGIGAIAEGGTTVLTRHLVDALGVTEAQLAAARERESLELARRVAQYRGERDLPDLRDRDVVLVDDGLATGVTAEAALRDLQARHPRRLVLAAPTCAPDTARRLSALVEVVCLDQPPDFRAVGLWYDTFDQTSDETVLDLLSRAAASTTGKAR
jgi:putative phosphoribosyl transferase